MYRSENGGLKWQRAGLMGYTVSQLVADAQQPATLYAVANSQLFISTDEGSTWEPRFTAIANDNILTIAVDPQRSGTLFLGQQKGFSKSEDGGLSWRKIPLSKNSEEGVGFLWINPQQPSNLLAISTYTDMYVSEDGGERWRERNRFRLPSNAIPFTWAVDPHQPQTIYAGTQSGAFRSDDGGITWQAINKGLGASALTLHINVLTIDPQDPQILYAGTRDGIFKTLDRGESWYQARQTSGSFVQLFIDPLDSQTLFAAGEFIKSSDGGRSWRQLPQPGASFPIMAMAFSWHQRGLLYVGTVDPADL